MSYKYKKIPKELFLRDSKIKLFATVNFPREGEYHPKEDWR